MSKKHERELRDWVVEMRRSLFIIAALGLALMSYLLVRADTLAEGVSERRSEMREPQQKVNLLERQMSADPSRTGGVMP